MSDFIVGQDTTEFKKPPRKQETTFRREFDTIFKGAIDTAYSITRASCARSRLLSFIENETFSRETIVIRVLYAFFVDNFPILRVFLLVRRLRAERNRK